MKTGRSRRHRGWPVVTLAVLLGACALPAGGPTRPPPATLAFPGAEGPGRFALGGRGGAVLYVTHLNDDGPGSLRAAIDTPGPRTVVFAVSGTIALKRELRIRHGRITIAGQTAPGDGITLRDHTLTIAADDVVLRYLRSRLGETLRVDEDAIGIVAGRRIILDHVSASWSTDEALSVSARFDTPERSFDEVTVQWSIISEGLNRTAAKPPGTTHGYGTLLRAGRGARVGLHHNLWAHHADRMPRPGNWLKPDVDPVGALYDFRNNVFYDWGGRRSGYNMDHQGTRSRYNFVANSYLSGPSSQGELAFEESSAAAQAWFEGNAMNGVVPADPWSLVVAHPQHLPGGLPPGYRLPQPLALGPGDIPGTEDAQRAHARVLAFAGASLKRDAVDHRVVNEVRFRTGRIIDSPDEVGGHPVLRSLPPPLDTDRDGLPDDWERARGLDPHNPADGARVDPRTGHTPLEDYLAHLVEKIGTLPGEPGTPSAQPFFPGAFATVRPTLHLVGDSTMADKPLVPPNPERGWGQLLRPMLKEPARLANHAANGRSTKRFLNEGRWAHVLSQLAPGDFVLIQFGHNDARTDDPERYAPADTLYVELLRRFVHEVRERGATPWLATPLVRRKFDAAGRLEDTHGAYPDAMRRVARELQVPLLDLQAASSALVQGLGDAGSKPLYLWIPPGQYALMPEGKQDNTHFTEAGARAMARLAIEAMRAQGLPTAAWVKETR